MRCGWALADTHLHLHLHLHLLLRFHSISISVSISSFPLPAPALRAHCFVDVSLSALLSSRLLSAATNLASSSHALLAWVDVGQLHLHLANYLDLVLLISLSYFFCFFLARYLHLLLFLFLPMCRSEPSLVCATTPVGVPICHLLNSCFPLALPFRWMDLEFVSGFGLLFWSCASRQSYHLSRLSPFFSLPLVFSFHIGANLNILMGPDAAFERRNCSKMHNPKSARISHCEHARDEGRHGKSKSSYGSRLCRTPDNQFMDLRLSKSSTPSRKSVPSRLSRVISNEELKRGSIYQSSESVRKLQGLRTIQSSRNRDVSLTFTIIDSLSRPSKNEGGSLAQKKRSPQTSSDAVDNLSYVGKNYIESHSTECANPSCNLTEDHISTPEKVVDGPPDGFLEICLDSEDAEWCCGESVAELLEAGLTEELKLTCDRISVPESDGNVLLEREKTQNLSKSASAKIGMADWHSQSESNFSKAIPKSRFSPLRRMLGPIKKSKFQKDLPFSTKGTDGNTTTSKSPSIMRDGMLRKSLLHDFSKVTHLTESDGVLFQNNLQNSVAASSPAHLQGLLKLEYKHDALSFEFSVRDPEEILAAKIWKTDNALNWVYTFYSVAGKKRSNRQKLLMVGQMQVSCYLCSEMRSGSLDTSTIMEFVLFDIAQARKSLAYREDQAGEGLGASDCEFSALSGTDRRTLAQAHSLLKNGSDSSDAYPWNPTDLPSHLEVAAIVIQVPFEKRESLKGKMGEKVEGTTSPDGDLVCRSTSLKNVTVVTASGTHGLPNTKEGWPSKLLDRWRSGGECDCGGWDMACPIVVLNNPNVKNVTDPAFAEDPWPPELFVQVRLLLVAKFIVGQIVRVCLRGSKERIPAVTITATGEGEYSIAFHARLSTLQAFSICVALLHTTEVSAAVGQEQNAYRLQCNSLKLLLEEEVRYLVEVVADEEKRKATKRKGDVPPYLVPDPPFSPIGRV
ncbi:hypothetical protein ACLOJK_024408 [Asimina triloba]